MTVRGAKKCFVSVEEEEEEEISSNDSSGRLLFCLAQSLRQHSQGKLLEGICCAEQWRIEKLGKNEIVTNSFDFCYFLHGTHGTNGTRIFNFN
jgi:hypothetical protein